MVFRLEPKLSPQFMQTYQILRPKTSHFRPATCADVECPAYSHGWRTSVDESTELGMKQAHYIRSQSGRGYREHRDESGLTVFTFDAGQECFTEHTQALDRPALFIRRKGDWRGYQSQPYVHSSPDNWVDDFATHQAELAQTLERG